MNIVTAPTLAKLLARTRGLNHWLILEETGKTLSTLYRDFALTDYDLLFLQTRYAEFLKRSPVVVPLQEATKNIFDTFATDSRKSIAPGVVVASAASQQDVLHHLRKCLEVTFYGNRKGMLRFYHPDIAAVLFTKPENVSAQWFGPIEQWIWQGEEKSTLPTAIPQWQALQSNDQTAATVKETDRVLRLSRHQEQALERYIRLMRAWKQYRQPGESLDDVAVRCRFLKSDMAMQAIYPELSTKHQIETPASCTAGSET
ncbi:DUF4123 domain-containing protein [Halomonas aquamarina]|uniref:DUF4123 domain-containing protein n=1 Tax=Vreelandella aquamarina TaxID=77097 RepID=A0ACC5VXW8_9GAMM|nr:DUF4123 domain-containing protein [Halomonas aquamarina]MBZ5488728.1 DUF4123 domain-containing protein [Halomonas aquamarina]